MSQFKLRKAVFTKQFGAKNGERIDYSKVEPAEKKDTELICSKSDRHLIIEVNQKSSYGSLSLDGERMEKFMRNIVRVKEVKSFENLKSLSLVMKNWYVSNRKTNLLETLAKYLRYNFKTLQILRLDFPEKECIHDKVVNSISDFIMPMLPDLPRLQSISLDFKSCKNLTDDSIMGLSNAIYPNRSLREFFVRFESWKYYHNYKYSKITNKSSTALYNQIVKNLHALEKLHFENNYLKITKQRNKSLSSQSVSDIWKANAFDLSLPDYFSSGKSVSGYSREESKSDELLINLLMPILPNLQTIQNLNINFGFYCDDISEKALIQIFQAMGKNLKALQNLHLEMNEHTHMPEKLLQELAVQIGSNFKNLKHLHLKLEFHLVTDATVAEYVNQISPNLENLEDLFLSFKGHSQITENSVSLLFESIRTLLARLNRLHIIMPRGINAVEEQFEFLADDRIRSIKTLILDFDEYFKMVLTNRPDPSVDENTAQNSSIRLEISLEIKRNNIFLPNIFNHLKPHLEVLKSLQLGCGYAKYKYSEIIHIFRQIVPDLKVLKFLNIIFPCYGYDNDADADLNQEMMALANILEPVFKTLQTLSLYITQQLNGEAVLSIFKMVMANVQTLKNIDLYFDGWASLNNTSEPESELSCVAHPELLHWKFSLDTKQENLMLLLNEMLPMLESFQSISCDKDTLAFLSTIEFNPKSLLSLGLNTGSSQENESTTISILKYIGTKFPTVEYLSVHLEDQQGTTDASITTLTKMLETDFLNLQYLSLNSSSCYKISNESLIAISTVLPSLKGISLNFNDCARITDDGIITFIFGPQVGGTIEHFGVSKGSLMECQKLANQLINNLSQAIAQGTQECSTLGMLLNRDATLSGLKELTQNYQSSLESYQKAKLDLDNCLEKSSKLSKMIESELDEKIEISMQSRFNKLQYIDLNFGKCNCTNRTIFALYAAVQKMEKLEHLSLFFEDNQLITEDAKAKLRNCVKNHPNELESCSLIFDESEDEESSSGSDE